jgi:DNA-binding XRE family transcriptional regulator
MPNPVGRPLKFKTVEELQTAIDEYFNFCDNRLVNGWDNKTNEQFSFISPAPYTMSGLARRIGISRQGLIDYENRDEFLDAIKEARERVHEDVETRLMEKAPTGAIFNLKNNFKWKDESKVENTVILPKPIADINVQEDLSISEDK